MMLSGGANLLGSVGSSYVVDPLQSFRRLSRSAEQTTGIDWRKADGTKDHPVWARVPIETEPTRSKHDLVVLLALNPI